MNSRRNPHRPPAPARAIPWGAIVVIVALGVRAAYLYELKDTDLFADLFGDAQAYHQWGARIAAGDWLGQDVFFQAPLYPYFLGTIYAVVGASAGAARVVQAALGTLACWLLYCAGRRMFSPAAGGIAGLALAVYSPAVFFDGLIQKSALDTLFTTALLCCVARLLSTPARRDWLLTGATIGCLSLTRENALVVAPVLVGWLWLYFRSAARADRLAWTGWLALGIALVLAPVGIRNRVVGGELALTTSQLGPNLYIGNNPRATGRYVPLQAGHGNAADERREATALAERAVGRPLTPREVSRYWVARAVSWSVEHPAAWLRLTAKKWLLFWNAAEITDTEDQGTYAEHSRLLAALTPVFHFGVLLPIAVAGAWLTIRDRARLGVLYALALAVAVSTVAFFVVARYRLPLVPVLVLFAAAGLREATGAWRSREWTRLGVAACVVVVAAVFSNWPMISVASQRAPTYYNLGLARVARGDVDGASRYFADAVRIDPNLGVAWANLGVAFGMKGDLRNAERCFREALVRDPGLANAHENLATVLQADGRRDEAIRHYREAVSLRPWAPGLQTKLGLALSDAGQPTDAIAAFQGAITLDPADRTAHFGLGRALAAQGRREPAREHLRRARELAEAARDDALVRAVDERVVALDAVR